jgi:hypothetical protein
VQATFMSVIDYGDIIYMHATASTLKSLDVTYHCTLIELSLFYFIFTGTVHINQRFSKSAGFSQPANFQPQSLRRLLKTITI